MEKLHFSSYLHHNFNGLATVLSRGAFCWREQHFVCGNPVESDSLGTADHPDYNVWQAVLRLRNQAKLNISWNIVLREIKLNLPPRPDPLVESNNLLLLKVLA